MFQRVLNRIRKGWSKMKLSKRSKVPRSALTNKEKLLKTPEEEKLGIDTSVS